MYHFDIEPYGNPFEQDKRILDVPEFQILSKQPKGQILFRYIVMVYDYYSPYRHMLLEQKKEKMIKNFGLTRKEIEKPFVSNAIAEYKCQQYEPIIETDKVFREKVAESSLHIDKTPLTSDNFGAMQKMMVDHEKIVNISLRLRDQVKDLFEAKKQGKTRGKRELTFGEENSQRIFDETFKK